MLDVSSLNNSRPTKDNSLATHLINSSYCGDLNEVKSLLRAGANVNMTAQDGVTPLAAAGQNGQL